MELGSPMQMVESRHSERTRCFLRARLVFNNRNSSFEGIIRNISADGAKIEVSNTLTLPTEFDLEVPQRGRNYRARLLWRDHDFVGVEFVKTTVMAGHSDEPEEQKFRRLEQENRRLKAAVADLTKRLEDLGQAVDHIL